MFACYHMLKAYKLAWGIGITMIVLTQSASAQSRAAACRRPIVVNPETKSLDEIHQDALKEGGRLILYAGGDSPEQQDYFKDLFEKRFPGVTLDVIVDYSKYNGRIEIQLATNNFIPDMIQWQTLQDFSRLKKRGLLMHYQPRSWHSIFSEFKDPEGYFVGIYILAFTNCANRYSIPNENDRPREAADYLKPELKGKITLTYPSDDDAVLFYFKLIVDKYGWDWVQNFVKQDIHWVRGTQEPGDAILQNRTNACPTTWCFLSNPEWAASYVALPKKDPFVTWPQTAAIFKDAKRPAAAKLYVNWMTDRETHETYWAQWSTLKDAKPPAGYEPLSAYRDQSDPSAFGKWMKDREAVELFRSQVTLHVGEVKGEASSKYPGIYPDKAVPHSKPQMLPTKV